MKKINEDKLWIIYSQNQDPMIKEYFIRKYTALVYKIVNKVLKSIKYSDFLERDDVVSNGFSGLLDAINKYGKTNKKSNKRKAKFSTFAYTRIFGSIIDGFRLAGKYFNKVNTSEFISNNIKDTRHKDMAKNLEDKLLKEELTNALNHLNLDENIIIRLLTFSSFNLKKISYIMNISVQKIKNIKKNAYFKLKNILQNGNYTMIKEVLNEEKLIKIPKQKNSSNR